MNSRQLMLNIGFLLAISTIMFYNSAPEARAQATTISVNPASVVHGANVTFMWQNGPGDPHDCIGIYNPDGSAYKWFFLNGVQSEPKSGLQNGSLTSPSPSIPGVYSVRFFSGTTRTIVASCALIIDGAGAKVKMNDDDSRINYIGASWQHNTHRGLGDFSDDVKLTKVDGRYMLIDAFAIYQ